LRRRAGKRETHDKGEKEGVLKSITKMKSKQRVKRWDISLNKNISFAITKGIASVYIGLHLDYTCWYF
jgi:hypothetical protein